MKTTFEKNPQVSFKSSYKFIKKTTSVILSLILSKHVNQGYLFENCILFDDVMTPILGFKTIYTNVGTRIYKGLKDIKCQKLDRMLVVIRMKDTLETIRVFTLNIIYKNIEDNECEIEDLDKHFAIWHQSGIPKHLKNQLKSLLFMTREALSNLPFVPHDHLNIEILLLERDSEEPTFNFLMEPLKTEFATVDTLYHQLKLELVYLGENSYSKMIEAKQNWSHSLDIIGLDNKANSDTSCDSSEIICSGMEELKQQHIVSNSTDKTYKHNVCSYTCTDPCKIKRHRSVKSGKNPSECNQYNYNSKKYSRVNKYFTSKMSNCNVCNYKTSNVNHFKRHIKVHAGVKLFNCTQCKYSCMDSWHLNRHMKRNHKI